VYKRQTSYPIGLYVQNRQMYAGRNIHLAPGHKMC
jgi:hypothetical protein